MKLFQSVKRFFYREPDFVIGTPDSPYMRRWWVIPRNRHFNIYLHNVLRDDDERALHDHPWWNLSIVLRGGYWEIKPLYRPLYPDLAPEVFRTNLDKLWRGPASVVLRRPTDAHRLVLDEGRPSWSLFITGPNVRTWGFWCPKGWRPWQEFCAPGDSSQIGRGCE
jgi:hypothetical protein